MSLLLSWGAQTIGALGGAFYYQSSEYRACLCTKHLNINMCCQLWGLLYYWYMTALSTKEFHRRWVLLVHGSETRSVKLSSWHRMTQYEDASPTPTRSSYPLLHQPQPLLSTLSPLTHPTNLYICSWLNWPRSFLSCRIDLVFLCLWQIETFRTSPNAPTPPAPPQFQMCIQVALSFPPLRTCHNLLCFMFQMMCNRTFSVWLFPAILYRVVAVITPFLFFRLLPPPTHIFRL